MLGEPLLDDRSDKIRKEEEQDWNNLYILFFTSILFALFVISEIIGALASNSLSLLGDASAMMVDVFSYVTNMYAEYKKMKHQEISPKMRTVLEIYIPSFSVCALLAVTAWIFSDAIAVLRGESDDDEVNVYFMYGFAAGNFVVDVISSYLFYRRKDTAFIDLSKRSMMPNLNMISALTHVGGDTLRTTSVFVAAVISTAFHQDSSKCDAWAAVVVSFTIVCAVIPLCLEIYKAAHREEEVQAPPSKVDYA